MGFSFRLAAKDSTYHEFCYTSRGALAGMTHRTMTQLSYHKATSRSPGSKKVLPLLSITVFITSKDH